MLLKEIYRTAIDMAMEADPRGKDGIRKYLARRKREYDDLPEKKRQDFDLETLSNPYADSRILLGKADLEVDQVMAGIDINIGEVLLADRLNEKGAGIDLLIAHHPEGESLAALHEVMDVQTDIMANYGVPVTVAEGMMNDRIGEVQRRFSPQNHTEAVDAARLLKLAMMCCHTATDNLVFRFLENLFRKEQKNIDTVGDVMKILHGIPEYTEAAKGKAGPVIFAGSERNRAGLVAPIEITGGTEASHIVYEKLAIAGVGTIIGMHASEEHRKECQKHHINLVIAGHMSSDSLGMNLFLDEIGKRGVRIIPCSGLIRVKRT